MSEVSIYIPCVSDSSDFGAPDYPSCHLPVAIKGLRLLMVLLQVTPQLHG